MGGRGGFTLLEVLVALTISGLLVSGIFQVIRANGRFLEMQSGREEVQQNARAALDLIAADLRGVPPGGVLEMHPERIRVLHPRAWGVLCNTLRPSSSAAWVLFPANAVPSDSIFNRPHWGLGIEQTPDPRAHTGTYRFIAAPTRATSGDPCNGIQPVPSGDRMRVGFVTPGSPFVTADSVQAGTPVMLYEELRYDVAAGGTVPGHWIRRMMGYTGGGPNLQPMAGPVPERGALQFTYLRADGVTPALTPAQIRQIGIQVVTRSRGNVEEGGVLRPQVDTASTTVYLRNIP